VFKLDMEAIRKTANSARLMANPANVAITANKTENAPVFVSQVAKLAGLAISHNSNETDKALLTTCLLTAAMAVCDHHGDGEAAREAMRRDCLETPIELKADLLECLRFTRPKPKNVEAQAPLNSQKSIYATCATTSDAWHELATAYNNHHFACRTCCAAGQGRGPRCGVGASMWINYQTSI
jgi:hypothetical protein